MGFRLVTSSEREEDDEEKEILPEEVDAEVDKAKALIARANQVNTKRRAGDRYLVEFTITIFRPDGSIHWIGSTDWVE